MSSPAETVRQVDPVGPGGSICEHIVYNGHCGIAICNVNNLTGNRAGDLRPLHLQLTPVAADRFRKRMVYYKTGLKMRSACP